MLPYLPHLFSRLVEGAGVVDYVVGGFDFFRFGQLRGHAARDFFAGGVERQLLAGGEAGDALLIAAGHDEQGGRSVSRRPPRE